MLKTHIFPWTHPPSETLHTLSLERAGPGLPTETTSLVWLFDTLPVSMALGC